MKHISQQYKGDITLFVTIIVSAVMLILLLALSQKVTVESRISRENMYSQQALQAANTGIDAWQYQWTQGGGVDITQTNLANWPNINTPTEEKDGEWIELSSVGGSSIQYRVEFQAGNTLVTPTIPPLIIAKGRVVRGNTIIERTLEQAFQTIAVSTPTPTLTLGEAQIRCDTLYNLRSRTSCNGVTQSGGIAYSAVKRSGIWKCELTQAYTAYSGYADTCAGTADPNDFIGTCTDPGVISSICLAVWGVAAGPGSSIQGFQPGGTETCNDYGDKNGKYHINVNCVWPTGTGPVENLP
jgi:hypothetical protein